MSTMKIDWREFKDIKTADRLDEYFLGREYTHAGFFHYTSIGAVESILSSHSFWIGCVADCNDDLDKAQFDSQKEFYSLCFSTGINENLPLWYLYSGIDGMGARIRLTQSTVKKIIDNGKYVLYECDNETKQPVTALMALENGITMNCTFRDVIYRKDNPDKDTIDLKYNTMTNYEVPKAEMEEYARRHPGFQKGIIWYYEKETRLIVQLIGEAKKVIQQGKYYKIILTFDENLIKNFNITFAPNIRTEEKEAQIKNNPAIRALRDSSSHVSLSEYAGTVHFRLCDRCKYMKQKKGDISRG